MTELPFTVSRLTYPEACEMRDKLKDAGIDCYLSIGCLSVYASVEQVPTLKKICFENKAHLQGGGSVRSEAATLLYGTDEEVQSLIERTNMANEALGL